VNAICEALTDGERRRRVGAGAAAVRTSDAGAQRQRPRENSSRRFISLPPPCIRCRVSVPINVRGNETRHRSGRRTRLPGYFRPNAKSMNVPSKSAILNRYVLFAARVFVLMLKIHCLSAGSHRNAVSGVVESGASFASE